MKLTQTVLMLFFGAYNTTTRIVKASIDDDVSTHRRIQRSLQGKTSKSSPKKGNNGKGGKKGDRKDCDTGVTQLDTSQCPIRIREPGRYVLPDDVQCVTDVNGIVIEATDVYLDCQDHIITGDVQDDFTVFGIVLRGGSSDVTITNCHATKFGQGIRADSFENNLIISFSSFNENRGGGGLFLPLDESTLTIVSSHFDQNEDPINSSGYGLEIRGGVAATIISSTANGNFLNGLNVVGEVKLSVWDSEFSNNGRRGVFFNDPEVGSLVKSVVCNNNAEDVIDPSIAQAVTCEKSSPNSNNGYPVCQCRCQT